MSRFCSCRCVAVNTNWGSFLLIDIVVRSSTITRDFLLEVPSILMLRGKFQKVSLCRFRRFTSNICVIKFLYSGVIFTIKRKIKQIRFYDFSKSRRIYEIKTNRPGRFLIILRPVSGKYAVSYHLIMREIWKYRVKRKKVFCI